MDRRGHDLRAVLHGLQGRWRQPASLHPGQAVPFDPETLDSYELGIKSDWFDRALRLNASVFYSDYSDLQLGLQICPQFGGTGAPCGAWANAGDAEIKGFELESVIRPFEHFLIDASYSYLDFEYTSINPAVGGPTRPNGIQLTYRPPYMPTRKWSVGAQYEINLGNGRQADSARRRELPGRSLYKRQQPGDQSDRELHAGQCPPDVARSRGQVGGGTREWTNITDEYYYLSRTDQFAAAGHSDGQPGRPREWAVTIKRRF